MAVKQIVPTEHEEQVQLMSWCMLMADRTGNREYDMIFAIPNGGARQKATAGKLKAEGVKPGVPDLMLPVQRGEYAGLFLEMKRRKGGTVSAEQKSWMTALTAQGYKCLVCHGAEEAMAAIQNYMNMGEGEESHGAGSQGDAEL